MECKYFLEVLSLRTFPSINRNILECKDISENRKIIIQTSINRNILECKEVGDGSWTGWPSVLIETYWNVKPWQFPLPIWPVWVLIETYWNVKINTHCIVSMIGLRINRNILECKDQLKRILFWFANGINRNILECKDVTSTDEPGQRNKY